MCKLFLVKGFEWQVLYENFVFEKSLTEKNLIQNQVLIFMIPIHAVAVAI